MQTRNRKYIASSIGLLLLNLLACNKSETKPEQKAERRTQSDEVEPGHNADQTARTGPRPDLTPEQVVRLQLEAIRDSEGTEDGLALAYRFTSRMGTLPQFAATIRSSEFQSMHGFRAAEYGSTRVEGDRARQIVTVHDNQGRIWMFLFELRKQQSGPDKDCWLTDAVYPGELEITAPISKPGIQSNASGRKPKSSS